ncbi:MAG: proline--tRNA ligase [Parachlamydiales bacterium]|jgi:prolyl-tRNA synthetase
MTEKKAGFPAAVGSRRNEDYAEWYQQVIKAADLAENSPVKGCMFIKPWGYGIWEKIQQKLDRIIKKTGHRNAYFPLFIPLSFLAKEAEHVEGFAKECAVVTHHRLEKNEKGELVPAGELEQPYVVRPTSEMIIGYAFSKWISSYRDLPLLINQWANVVRWEMRTRLFLRTSEFLWQEGHTAHATEPEAREEALKMLGVYADFAERMLALPVVKGEKSALERFPGAVNTYCIEALMQDKKALQAGTSHFLGQNFSRSCEIKFNDQSGKEAWAWTTSWGVSTRLIGGLIMAHSDDDGLVLPPNIAPAQIVLIPVVHQEENKAQVLGYLRLLKAKLEKVPYLDGHLEVELDERDLSGPEKKWEWIKKGIPLRLEIGPRDLASGLLGLNQRHLPHKETLKMTEEELVQRAPQILQAMQEALFSKAKAFLDQNTVKIGSKEEFYRFFTPKNPHKPEIHGGLAEVFFSLDENIEAKLKADLGVTLRCLPLEKEKTEGVCFFTGKKGAKKALFAKAY